MWLYTREQQQANTRAHLSVKTEQARCRWGVRHQKQEKGAQDEEQPSIRSKTLLMKKTWQRANAQSIQLQQEPIETNEKYWKGIQD